MNHISFLDILALDALRPVHFIAKSEIRDWPVIGTLCVRTGTIFIERGRRHAVHQVLGTMARQLREGEVVSFFPEGTTSDGTRLLPFHTNLFEAAVRGGAPVRPVVLRYEQYGQASTLAAFIDDLSLLDCALTVFAAQGLSLHLQILDPVPSEGLTRHQLSARVREAMPVESIDLVLVPGLAFDPQGRRLGRGGGFYDRSLPLCAPGTRLVAVVRDDEVLDALPAEPHDVRMTHALTPGSGLIALAGRPTST